MKVRIKRLVAEASIPRYLHKRDGGMDLIAVSKIFDENGNVEYGTGLAIDIPEGHIGLIFPVRGNSKKDLLLSNSIGIINPGCSEEIVLRFKPAGYFASEPKDLSLGTRSEEFDYICFGKEFIEDEDMTSVYAVGDRIGQLIIIPRPTIEWEEVYDFEVDETSSDMTGRVDFQGPIML